MILSFYGLSSVFNSSAVAWGSFSKITEKWLSITMYFVDKNSSTLSEDCCFSFLSVPAGQLIFYTSLNLNEYFLHFHCLKFTLHRSIMCSLVGLDSFYLCKLTCYSFCFPQDSYLPTILLITTPVRFFVDYVCRFEKRKITRLIRLERKEKITKG